MEPKTTLTAILPALLLYSGIPAPPTRAMVFSYQAAATNEDNHATAQQSDGLSLFDNDLTATSSVRTHPRVEGAYRATTPAEIAAGEIRSWVTLPDNWDGEGSAAPNQISAAQAVDFVLMLGDDFVAPKPQLLDNGNASLFWSEGAVIADLEFYPDGTITYYIESAEYGIHKGATRARKTNLPPPLAVLLPVRPREDLGLAA